MASKRSGGVPATTGPRWAGGGRRERLAVERRSRWWCWGRADHGGDAAGGGVPGGSTRSDVRHQWLDRDPRGKARTRSPTSPCSRTARSSPSAPAPPRSLCCAIEVLRFLTDGHLDPSFGVGGYATINFPSSFDYGYSIAGRAGRRDRGDRRVLGGRRRLAQLRTVSSIPRSGSAGSTRPSSGSGAVRSTRAGT